jgi:hypothetical protein
MQEYRSSRFMQVRIMALSQKRYASNCNKSGRKHIGSDVHPALVLRLFALAPLANYTICSLVRLHCWINALWRVALYYANSLFMMEV